MQPFQFQTRLPKQLNMAKAMKKPKTAVTAAATPAKKVVMKATNTKAVKVIMKHGYWSKGRWIIRPQAPAAASAKKVGQEDDAYGPKTKAMKTPRKAMIMTKEDDLAQATAMKDAGANKTKTSSMPIAEPSAKPRVKPKPKTGTVRCLRQGKDRARETEEGQHQHFRCQKPMPAALVPQRQKTSVPPAATGCMQSVARRRSREAVEKLVDDDLY